jgi:hypothetical protein
MMTTIFDAIVRSDRNGTGAAGETFAKDLLERSGYDAQKRTERYCGDLRAVEPATGEFWNIEVKTAKRRPDGRHTFQLMTDSGTDYRYSDYVLLLAICGSGVVVPFLIPVNYLKRRGAKTITLPKNLNASKWSHFRIKGKVKL